MSTKARRHKLPNRRTVLRGAGAVGSLSAIPLLAACDRKDDHLQKLWTQWQADWRWMQAIAVKRQWEVTPLKIAPPAAHAALDAVERRHGLKFPPQLRAVLTELSAHVRFGWHIPSHLQALEREDMPYGSGIRDAIWDLAVIDTYAIPNFLGWKRDLAQRDRTEAPNTPRDVGEPIPVRLFAERRHADDRHVETTAGHSRSDTSVTTSK